MGSVPEQLDHLVYAVPDLAQGVRDLAERLGAQPLPGGSHPAWRTRNAILPLGPASYLEIIGPDPDAPAAPAPEIFGIATLAAPRLATWAAKSADLAGLAARARSHGIDLGAPGSGRRLQPDGTRLAWELTDPFRPRAGGVLPFFIHWRGEAHPASAGPALVSLVSLRAEHPDAAAVREQLRALEVELEVAPGPVPALFAVLRTARGTVTLS
jgi:hypothetical protein